MRPARWCSCWCSSLPCPPSSSCARNSFHGCCSAPRCSSFAPRRRVWLLVPLIAIWANLHGAVLVGLAIAAAYLVLDRLRREPFVAVSVLVTCCAALFVTPAFAKSGSYYLGVLKSEAAQRGEGMWAPLSLHNP